MTNNKSIVPCAVFIELKNKFEEIVDESGISKRELYDVCGMASLYFIELTSKLANNETKENFRDFMMTKINEILSRKTMPDKN